MPWLLPLLMLGYRQEQGAESDGADDDILFSGHLPPMTTREIIGCVFAGFGLGLLSCVIAWYLVSGRIGLSPFLTF